MMHGLSGVGHLLTIQWVGIMLFYPNKYMDYFFKYLLESEVTDDFFH